MAMGRIGMWSGGVGSMTPLHGTEL